MLVVARRFLESIPGQKKEFVINKLGYFKKMIESNHNNLHNLPKGFWIRKVAGTDVFKFRLNSGDRILFTISKTDRDDIILLSYCNHDSQITRAYNISKNSSLSNAAPYDIAMTALSDEDELYEQEIIDKNVATEDLSLSAKYIVDPEYISVFLDENSNDYLYYLTDEQYRCLLPDRIKSTVVVSGAAGSGKTTIAVHKLIACSKSGMSCAYITYTQLLTEHVKDIFDKFHTVDCLTAPDFYSFHNFYKTVLNVNNGRIVTSSMFYSWFSQNRYKLDVFKNISAELVWAEIRGVLKGYIGFETKELTTLQKKRIISLETYINMPADYSILNTDEKKKVHKICERYNTWLSNKKYYDENDLALDVIAKYAAGKSEKYDYVIVDELQDLTELQMYMLSCCVKEHCNMMMFGDENQIVNPNFFDFRRIRNIIYGLGMNGSMFSLSDNYRNPEDVVFLMNGVIKDKQSYIEKSAFENVEQNAIRKTSPPGAIAPNRENLLKLLELIADRHYCAVVVFDESDRERLIEIHKEASGRIFTVNEIKGLEYENVYCFNIISRFEQLWDDIYSGRAKNKVQYKFYMNILYVALSRCKTSLFFYEEAGSNPFMQKYREHFNTIHRPDTASLKTEGGSTESDWAQEALRLEKNNNLKQAEFIRNTKLENNVIDTFSLPQKTISSLYPSVRSSDLTDNSTEFNRLINKGFHFYQKRDYPSAKTTFEAALALNPNSHLPYYCLGCVFHYLPAGRELSIGYFDKSIAIDPDFYLAYLDKAAALYALKWIDEYKETLNDAIRAKPDCLNAYDMLTVPCYDEMDYQNAINYHTESLKYEGYRFDSANKKWVWMDKKSLQEYRRYIQNRINEAKKSLRSVTRPEKHVRNPFEDYNQNTETIGRASMAMTNFINYADKNPKLFQAYMDLINGKNTEAALLVLEKTLKESDINPEVMHFLHQALSNAYIEIMDFERGTAHLLSCIAILPENWEDHNTYGIVLMRQGRFEEAEEAYNKAFSLCHGNARMIVKGNMDILKELMDYRRMTGITKIQLSLEGERELASELSGAKSEQQIAEIVHRYEQNFTIDPERIIKLLK